MRMATSTGTQSPALQKQGWQQIMTQLRAFVRVRAIQRVTLHLSGRRMLLNPFYYFFDFYLFF